MVKILFSPLFISLSVLWVSQFYVSRIMWKRTNFSRVICTLSFSVLLVLTFLCSPVASTWLYHGLFQEIPQSLDCPLDTVVVLSGGHIVGGKELSMHTLSGETTLRALRGFELFKTCGAKKIILSGTSRCSNKQCHGQLMQELAVKLGIADEHIELETESKNTREHVLNLKEKEYLTAHSKIAVVTSPWHLKRATREFRRIFSDVYPVAAYSYQESAVTSFDNWLPTSRYLAESTKLIHEYLGMLYYGILAL